MSLKKLNVQVLNSQSVTSGQFIRKIESKRTDGRTRPIAVPCPLARLAVIGSFSHVCTVGRLISSTVRLSNIIWEQATSKVFYGGEFNVTPPSREHRRQTHIGREITGPLCAFDFIGVRCMSPFPTGRSAPPPYMAH